MGAGSSTSGTTLVDEVGYRAFGKTWGVAPVLYQGGHVEYFRLPGRPAAPAVAGMRVFGGGGGVIVPAEIASCIATASTSSPGDGSAWAWGMIGEDRDALRRLSASPHLEHGRSGGARRSVARAAPHHRFGERRRPGRLRPASRAGGPT